MFAIRDTAIHVGALATTAVTIMYATIYFHQGGSNWLAGSWMEIGSEIRHGNHQKRLMGGAYNKS